ncbi:MAG: hypothetical protein Q4A15_09595 [Prevotellaceae bacterium]|nr:hypothetical protein [Prevotellaceae bacterium]
MKRIITKIGDVFCVKIDENRKRYFQYIANDWHQLNSSTIRVFKTDYPLNIDPSTDEIVADDVEFYSHTILSFGVRNGFWQKVGKSNNVGCLDSIMFRCANDIDIDPTSTKSYNWYVWNLGDEDPVFIGELTEDFAQKTYDGEVFPPKWIVERIKYGRWLCQMDS